MKCPVCNEEEVVPLDSGTIPDCNVCEAAIYGAAHEELDPDDYPYDEGLHWPEADNDNDPNWYDEDEVTIH